MMKTVKQSPDLDVNSPDSSIGRFLKRTRPVKWLIREFEDSGSQTVIREQTDSDCVIQTDSDCLI